MFDLLIEGAVVVTMNRAGTVLKNGWVAVTEGRIVEVGEAPGGETRARMKVDGGEGPPAGAHRLPPRGALLHKGQRHRGRLARRDGEHLLPPHHPGVLVCRSPPCCGGEDPLRHHHVGEHHRGHLIHDQESIDAHFEGAQSLGARTFSGTGAPGGAWPKRAEGGRAAGSQKNT